MHIKDALQLLVEQRPLLASDVRQPPYVPGTATVDVVLRRMQEAHTQLVVVLDEQGGTAGIVTIQDLFEEVVGSIDEEPEVFHEISTTAEGALLASGIARLEDVGEALGTTLTHDEVDTVSGLVLTLLERPPQVGDTVTYHRVRFEVTAVEGRGVQACRVALDSTPSPRVPTAD